MGKNSPNPWANPSMTACKIVKFILLFYGDRFNSALPLNDSVGKYRYRVKEQEILEGDLDLKLNVQTTYAENT